MTSHVNRPVYLFLRLILKNVVRCFFLLRGFQVEGRENLPRKRKSCILICNHAAFIDSVYIICAVHPRFTICGAKPKYFTSVLKRFLFGIANVLKVENHDQFLNDCRDLLRSGENILIYPEMGRHPEGLGELKTWAAELALAHAASVIPCYLYGTTIGQPGPKKLVVGQAISAVGSATGLTDTFRKTLLSLKPDSNKVGKR